MNSNEQEKQGNSDELFESLFRHASTRSRPAKGEEARIRAELHREWQSITGRRRRVRITAGIAVAASVVLAIVLYTGAFNQPAPIEPARMVASLVKQTGRVTVGPGQAGGAMQVVQTGEMFKSGSVIATAYDARLAIRWLDGESIRLDTNTRIALISETEIELLSGRVYVDSHAEQRPVNTKTGLGINTPFGRVQHLGTQYMTYLEDSAVVVSVRHGSVAVTGSREKSIADSGQQLSLSNHGEVALQTIETFGKDWQWIEEISPGFDLNGRSMADFFGWVSRESGQSLEYLSPQAETLAHDTLVRGTIDLQPMRALELMLQTSDLVAETQSGVIRIGLR